MRQRDLLKVSVTTTAQAEDAVAELLSTLLGESAASYTDAVTQATTVTVFCKRSRPGLEAMHIALRAGLRRIRACGLCVGLGRIRTSQIKPQDWAHSWKRHFKVLEFGDQLLIKPSWSRRRPRKNQAIVLLDPGLSFGTGQHPTTAFCLEQLVKSRRRNQAQSFLDIGTGSGILAIAAAKLGFAPVEAFDFDPEAVRVARANARRNQVQHRLQIRFQDLTQLAQQSQTRFDVICANLTADLLFSEQRRILGRLAHRGTLVLAGILRAEFAGVQHAYRQAGLRLVAGRTQKEWRAGTFRFAR